MTKIVPNLGLSKLRDSELEAYTQDKIDRINGLTEFAAVNPSTTVVNDKLKEYVPAQQKSLNGSTDDTAVKDQKRLELESLITSQAYNCASIANGDLVLFLKTGYKAKDTKGTPTGPLPQVTGFELSFGNSEGELLASWTPIADAQNFTLQVFSDINKPEESLIKEFLVGKIGRGKEPLPGLPSGQKVLARVRANGGSTGFGPWSDPAEKRVP